VGDTTTDAVLVPAPSSLAAVLVRTASAYRQVALGGHCLTGWQYTTSCSRTEREMLGPVWAKAATYFAAVKVSRVSRACEAFFSGDKPPKLQTAHATAASGVSWCA
jgi:hypothetical protein